jgi:hypothetical protein
VFRVTLLHPPPSEQPTPRGMARTPLPPRAPGFDSMRAEISSASLPSPCFIPPLEPGYEPNLLVPHLPPCLEICKLQLFAPC